MNKRDALAASGKTQALTMRAQIVRADGSIEDLGVVAYWHRNPLRRLLYKVTRKVS